MKKVSTTTLTALATVILALPVNAASPAEGIRSVLESYEAVRTALVTDELEAIEAPAAELADAVRRIREHPTTAVAGVPVEKLAEVESLLPELQRAAEDLAEAANLPAARDSFYALSKPLVRWRQAAGDGPAVVYCSMKKRSWLQDADEEIGNPYYGQEMAGCGEVVSK